MGIKYFKIRARKDQINKAVYALTKGAEDQIQIAVDMTQNLMNPGQSIEDIISFYDKIIHASNFDVFFFEEVLGITDGNLYPELRKKIPIKIAGGEIVTTAHELNSRIEKSWYDIVQPDASVVGGIKSVIEVFQKGRNHHTDVFVHCWGGPVCMAANYHAAIAAGGTIAEWPMPYYPLRDAMMAEPWNIKAGKLILSDQPGLGVILTKEIEKEYPFREEAVYSCLPEGFQELSDEIWNV